MRSKFIFVLFCLFFSALSAQEMLFLKENQKNNLEAQKANTKKIEIQTPIWKPSPIKASLYSAILPGLGQLYNKRYWKAPFMLGTLTGGILFSFYQRKVYRKHQDNYRNAINGNLSQENSKFKLNINSFYEIKNNAQRYYNYVVLFTVIGYVLNIMDGFVDAHLHEIRKDKQLNLSFYPSIIPSFNHQENLAFGMTLNLNF